MSSYIARRLLLVIPTLILVTLIVFFSIRLTPGSILDLMVQEQEFSGNVDRAWIDESLKPK